MPPIRTLLSPLLVAALAGGCLVGGGSDPTSALRTDGATAPAPTTTATTVPAGTATTTASSAPGSTTSSTTAAPTAPAASTTTVAPAPSSTTTTIPPVARHTGVQDGAGRPVWAPVVDATGATDVSAAMAAFLAAVPDGATIDLQPGGRYRMESTLVISGRRDLTVRGNGATFVATTTGDLMRASVRIAHSHGITLRDLAIVGANPTAGAKDRIFRPELAGQHGVDLNSATQVSLIGLTITDVYGDFVYVGQRDGGPPSDGVLVQRGTFARSGRQGVTFTSARNVVVEHSTISEAKRSTFDFEPGRGAGLSVSHVTIRGNRVERGPLLFVAAEGHGPVDHVTIEGNQLTGMTMGIAMEDLDGGVRRDWKVLDNTADMRSGNPHGATMRFVRIDGLVVRGNHQPMKPDRNMVGVGATSSCNLSVHSNTFPDSVGQLRAVGTC
ncbi:MAG: right-handed parallel beta-helix repeat-containing protein [Acidimicrobiia bacterium]